MLRTLIALLLAASAAAFAGEVDPNTFVGNVYGIVVDVNGDPVEGAIVGVVDPSSAANVRAAGRDAHVAVANEAGLLTTTTNARGEFLINSIPTPNDGATYAIAVAKPSFALALIDEVRVLPGATMALEATVTLGATDSRATFRYRHERTQRQASEVHAEVFAGSIFATREGLVGGTTANGHVIVTNDRFVALPSRRALASRNGHEKEVRLTYHGRTTVAPVWDVGPWNTHDDYWNPAAVRETFTDLPMGMPEAEAAFYRKYNNGNDERGRLVRTPAGIDLADGTFWLDLGMVDNDRVSVEYLWVDNDGPLADAASLPRRVTPGSRLVARALVSDATTGNAPIAAAEFFVDAVGEPGSGIAAVAEDGAFDSASESVVAQIASDAWPAGSVHTLFVRARDVYGNWGAVVSVNVVAENVPPRRRTTAH